jgi:hypothetical protein
MPGAETTIDDSGAPLARPSRTTRSECRRVDNAPAMA